MSDTCAVNETIVGYPLGDCGKPSAATVPWHCPNGHQDQSQVCGGHLSAAVDFPMWCAECAEDGNPQVPMEMGIEVQVCEHRCMPCLPGRHDHVCAVAWSVGEHADWTGTADEPDAVLCGPCREASS